MKLPCKNKTKLVHQNVREVNCKRVKNGKKNVSRKIHMRNNFIRMKENRKKETERR